MSNYYNKYWQLIIQNENSNPKIYGKKNKEQ